MLTETEAKKRFQAARQALEIEAAQLRKLDAFVDVWTSEPKGQLTMPSHSITCIAVSDQHARELHAHWTALAFEAGNASVHLGDHLGRWHLNLRLELAPFAAAVSTSPSQGAVEATPAAA